MGRVYLIPVDPNENCKRALKFYMDVLHKEDDTVIFLHVAESNLKADSTNSHYIGDRNGESKNTMDSSKALGHKYLAWGRDAGINVKAFVQSDAKPGVAIIKAAQEHEVDHIILGSRGLNALGRTLIGSVSNYVMNHTQVPVTVVPCPEDEKPTSGIHRISLH